jgi:tripartite-type tricarboxylate transporter receptor subunit TctC
MSYASAGAGTPPHLACELFKQATSTDIVHVPYRGAAPALQDVLSGQADFVCDPGIAFPHVRSGKAKLLAIVSEKRSPFFPDVPTVAEQGFKGNYMDIWFGMWAPNGIPTEIVSRLSRELAKALAQPSVKARYADLGAENVALDNGEFRNLLSAEGKLLSGLIRDQKISAEYAGRPHVRVPHPDRTPWPCRAHHPESTRTAQRAQRRPHGRAGRGLAGHGPGP